MTERAKRFLAIGALLVAAAAAAAGFHDAGHQYRDFRLAYGKGIFNITDTELVLYIWYFVFGTAAVVFLSVALAKSEGFSALKGKLLRLFAWRFFIPVATLALLAETLLFQTFVLQNAPITDDESVYVFIAKTLLGGRVANPAPQDPEFFANQFLVLDGYRWYGKYPIGHPLLLALGEAAGLRFVIVPLVACGVFLLTYLVGRRLFSHNRACLSLCLLLLSPHFVFMAASQLSQPASSLTMMLGLLALLKISDREGFLWPALAGMFFGYGLLVRPFPGCLFVVAAAAGIAFGMRGRSPGFKLKAMAIGAVPVLLAAGVLFLVNRAQTGDPLHSGYDVKRNVALKPAATDSRQQTAGAGDDMRGLALFGSGDGAITVSLGGSILRENFWLFGWPVSLLFVFFVKSDRRMTALWGMIAAALAYRVLLPKTCVGTLGPVYMTEIVPLLALASADGMARLNRVTSNHDSKTVQKLVSAVIVSSFAVAALTFVPVQVREIRRSTTIWRSAYQLLGNLTSQNALVFANWMVHPYSDTTWAGYPPPPSPKMDDKVLFVRELEGADGPTRNVDFWKRRFPERSAWVFRAGRQGAMITRVEKPEDFNWAQGERR